MADDDDEAFGGMYEDGHWEWNEMSNGLIFVSDMQQQTLEVHHITTKAPTGAIEFRDNVDVVEQIRFRRRYQRRVKLGDPDVVTIQDIKDIAIYTAPVSIQSPGLINLLHLPTTERFLRALILYCQYYLQIAEEMARRSQELESKVRTPACDTLEHEFRDNLADLRLLVAKEYSTITIGGDDTKKYHHMGPQKRRRSLSDKDARQFETLVRMCVQIVWLALGRKSFNQIELEVNRIFKSEIFNSVEHNLKTGYLTRMSPAERNTMIGRCVRRDKKLHTRSPLMNEVFCHREIDYRMMALGIIKYVSPTPRLRYLICAVASPEENLIPANVTVGILGMPRSAFDSMLKPIPVAVLESKMQVDRSQHFSPKPASAMSLNATKKSTTKSDIIPPICLPPADKPIYFPKSFPHENERILPCSEEQRKKWQNRLQRLLQPYTSRHKIVHL